MLSFDHRTVREHGWDLLARASYGRRVGLPLINRALSRRPRINSAIALSTLPQIVHEEPGEDWP